MNYVFYDLETTGLSIAFDQPLQFAAILTDENFNEIERSNIRCQLAPHIIPSPKALIVTNTNPTQLVDPSLPNLFEFSGIISDLLSRWSPATWMGYNSINFDEEVLRQTFYQNLQPNLYATQLNGNRRLDVLKIVYAVWCRDRDIFRWPDGNDGRPSFKLERLAVSNGLNGHNAHDALGDVEATLHLARKVAAGNPSLWRELLIGSNKKCIQDKLNSLEPLELIARFDEGPPKSVFGCFSGSSLKNPSKAAFFDLEHADPLDFIDADDGTILKALSNTPKIISTVAANRSPTILEIEKPSKEYLDKASLIAGNPDFRARVGRLMDVSEPEFLQDRQKPVERKIYERFYSAQDRSLLAEFQRVDWSRRRQIVDELADPRLQQLGKRLFAFYQDTHLTEHDAKKYKRFLVDRWSGQYSPENGWTTRSSALRDIALLREQAETNRNRLDEIEEFIINRFLDAN